LGLAVVAIILLRAIAAALLPLAPEEAYYWMYGQFPSLSYFDHPPMVAWVIQAGTILFGDSEFGVRFGNQILMLATSMAMYAHARMWHGHRIGLTSAVAVQILPAYFAAGFVATMDAALLLFWITAMWGVGLALKLGRASGWYVAGAACGAAMLSKYTGVFILAGAGLAVLLHGPWRRWMFSPHPYLGVLLAAAVFSPVIAWNAQHDWASFRFQFVDRFDDNGLRIDRLASYLGIQLLAATPILVITLGLLLRRTITHRRLGSSWRVVALVFSLPLLVVMLQKSLRFSIHVNWTLPAYLSLIPATTHMSFVLWRRASRRTREIAIAQRSLSGLRWTAIACIGVNAVACLYLIFLQPRLGYVSAFGPWKQLAEIVEDYEDRLPEQAGHEPVIITEGKYRMASVLAFYRLPIEDDFDSWQQTSSQWLIEGRGLGYEYWTDRKDWIGRTVIYLDSRKQIPKSVATCFDHFEIIHDPRLKELGDYQLAVGTGYRGPLGKRRSGT